MDKENLIPHNEEFPPMTYPPTTPTPPEYNMPTTPTPPEYNMPTTPTPPEYAQEQAPLPNYSQGQTPPPNYSQGQAPPPYYQNQGQYSPPPPYYPTPRQMQPLPPSYYSDSNKLTNPGETTGIFALILSILSFFLLVFGILTALISIILASVSKQSSINAGMKPTQTASVGLVISASILGIYALLFLTMLVINLANY
jgi:hypothetical protein